jgi:hypothetical protein
MRYEFIFGKCCPFSKKLPGETHGMGNQNYSIITVAILKAEVAFIIL